MEASQDTLLVRLDQASQEFESRWQSLVSTTNWEKGRIIAQWRSALVEAGAGPTEYSDEAWSRRVGGVTGQHVGRLRRVWERFGSVFTTYQGLFWSHFQATIDWDDAELWLEGAVQSGWSISQMRDQRWEALGGSAEDKPRPEDVISTELDEDFLADRAESATRAHEGEARSGAVDAEHDESAPWEETSGDETVDAEQASPEAALAVVKPFENLPELPDDLADAFESFKLAILRHKRADWSEVDCDAVLASLDALKALAVAPSGDE